MNSIESSLDLAVVLCTETTFSAIRRLEIFEQPRETQNLIDLLEREECVRSSLIPTKECSDSLTRDVKLGRQTCTRESRPLDKPQRTGTTSFTCTNCGIDSRSSNELMRHWRARPVHWPCCVGGTDRMSAAELSFHQYLVSISSYLVVGL